MTKDRHFSGRQLIVLALGLGVMVVAAKGGEDMMSANAADAGVRCDIKVEELGSGVRLQGIVTARQSVQGSYRLQVSKSGGGQSNVSQAGDFDARPDAPTRLGTVQLGGDGGTYKARLQVMWDDRQIECEKTIGGGWL